MSLASSLRRPSSPRVCLIPVLVPLIVGRADRSVAELPVHWARRALSPVKRRAEAAQLGVGRFAYQSPLVDAGWVLGWPLDDAGLAAWALTPIRQD